jgi:uncharacterized protein DUF6570
MCQDYPSALEDLTAIEECLIAICHPVGRILKLRPGGKQGEDRDELGAEIVEFGMFHFLSMKHYLEEVRCNSRKLCD